MSGLQEKLEKLYTLLNTGVLNELEFNRQKAMLVEEFIAGDAPPAEAAEDLPEETPAEEPVIDLSGPKTCCRLRGLPFTVTANEVLKFLDGLKIDWDNGGIKLVMDTISDNICSGIGFACFSSEAEAQRAAQLKDRQPIDHRYVEVAVCTTGEMAAGLAKKPRPEGLFPPRFSPYAMGPMGKGKGKGMMMMGKGKGMGYMPPMAAMGKGKGKGFGAYGMW
eukprot:EG_transcript_28400